MSASRSDSPWMEQRIGNVTLCNTLVMFEDGYCASPSAREYTPNVDDEKHRPITNVYTLLYTVSNSLEANNLEPNENISRNERHENTSFGIQRTKNHKRTVRSKDEDTDCATKAHTP